MGEAEKPDPDEAKAIAKVLAEEKKRFVKELNRALRYYVMRHDSANYLYTEFGKQRGSWTWQACEVWGGADFPKAGIANRSKASLATLQGAIKGQKWKTLTKAFEDAERDINAFNVAIDTYYRKFDGGAGSAISILKFTKTTGFIAVGVVATTFVGGPAAVALGVEGLKGAATAAAVGGVLKVQVDTVATTIGRELAGEKVDYGKVVWNDIKDSGSAAIVSALFQGPPAKFLNDQVAKTVVKDFIKDKNTLAVVSRLGVATTRKMLVGYYESKGKAKAKAVAPKVVKGMKGNESQDDVMARIIGETVQSKDFLKYLESQGVSLENSK